MLNFSWVKETNSECFTSKNSRYVAYCLKKIGLKLFQVLKNPKDSLNHGKLVINIKIFPNPFFNVWDPYIDDRKEIL